MKTQTPLNSTKAADGSQELRHAIELHQLGRLDQAEPIYKTILTEHPNHFDARHLLGVLRCQQGRHAEAYFLIGAALKLNPNDVLGLSNFGLVLAKLGSPKEALLSHDKALALRPNFAEAHNNRGTALKDLKRYEEALSSYDRALSLNPNFADALYNRGNALRDLKRPEEALLSYDKALAIRPDFAEARNNRGTALLDLKRSGEALANFDEAIGLKPDYAEAHCNRGNALLDLRRCEEALDSYDKALAFKVDYGEAISNRGNALLDLKRPEEALTSYDKALSLNPEFADAFHNRGKALREFKRLEEALLSYDKALAIKPDFAEAHCDRGTALLDLNRFVEAVASYQKALALKPDYAVAHNNLGNILRDLGRLNKARDCLERAIQFAPRKPLFYWSLANSKQFVLGDPHLAALEDLAQDIGGFSAAEQVHLHFALGKAFADARQYELSFHHLLQGNALRRRQIAYDEAATLRSLHRLQAVFTPELMRSKQSFGHPSSVPIFILGMPRSGTTLVEQILASHPNVFGAGELYDFEKAVVRYSHRVLVPFPELVRIISDADLHQLGGSYLDAIRANVPETGHITDKMPANFIFASLINLALPQARIIHTRRDPIDTCLSCFATLFTEGQSYSYDLGELGRYYRAYEAVMQHWRNVLPNGVMLDVQYEEAIDDLEGQARRLIAHCGLDWDDACLAFHKTKRVVRTASVTQVRQPIYKSSVGRWRAYEQFLSPLTKSLAGEGASPSR